ncbi:YpjP family protein [Bacillus kwashiorkori]|uniref:YpjP family protein n=1 Tax=Bacillus kwashiorkori TaxID=1522318 RepID=UPI0008F95584|nr:YpjP family protein [Bacillus kwashiorkori]
MVKIKRWLRKTFVALVTILSFGLISPYHFIDAANELPNQTNKDDVLESDTSQKDVLQIQLAEREPTISEKERFLKEAVSLGQQQAWKKFGSKIGPVIEDEFLQIILPKIEQAIEEVTNLLPDEHLAYLAVSEAPGKGKSEKIFHIYNVITNEDIIRFHVRRDLKPQEGYWFNFHYHTFMDQYHTHHDLGSIYWDKNMPPHWVN